MRILGTIARNAITTLFIVVDQMYEERPYGRRQLFSSTCRFHMRIKNEVYIR